MNYKEGCDNLSSENKHKYNNKLIQEKSPYLLQHAHNPVDWYPWGGEAFARAIAEDKPIFLSIGYSTCHWCHVMERESFEDEVVAQILNKYFVSIKVDREERPDIDHIYMNICQALTRSGGWPLTIIMTAEKKPFFAGTYFPKKSGMGHTGIIEILEQVADAWHNDKKALIASSEKITAHVLSSADESHSEEVSKETVNRAFSSLAKSFDTAYGGFSGAPKFPMPHNLSFLLRYWKTTGNQDALKMVEKTLDSMHEGGIYDHIGHGFSRYSTDKKWLVPHFEKMLYDNALLAIAYLEAFQATKNERYSGVASNIFEYILRDMTAPEGGFYSAEDADSEGEEGKFYVWTRDEIIEVLGEEAGIQFCLYYDITKTGNFEDGTNIPNLISNRADVDDEMILKIEEMRKKLFVHREKRVHPYKDDKILTAWNGLMIAALSMGYRVLGDPSYRDAAEKAVLFIDKQLRREDGRLMARYRDGETAHLAYLDDYAFLVWGLIELYEAAFNPDILKLALKLNEDMMKYFYDTEKGGFYLYGSDGEQLIARPKDIYDGALPSGNSVLTLNLLRLARITGNSDLEDISIQQCEVFGTAIKNYPAGYTYMLEAVLFIYSNSSEITIVGDKSDADIIKMIDKINSSFLPYAVFILKDVAEQELILASIIPAITEHHMVEGKASAYICENHACKPPINEVYAFEQELAKLS